MSEHAALIRQMLAGQEHWVELEPGKAVKFRRPADTEGLSVLHGAGAKRGTPHLFLDDLTKYAVDWRGFSEADLLGHGIGNSDPLSFDREVWRLAVADNLVWFGAALEGLLGAITKQLTASA